MKVNWKREARVLVVFVPKFVFAIVVMFAIWAVPVVMFAAIWAAVQAVASLFA